MNPFYNPFVSAPTIEDIVLSNATNPIYLPTRSQKAKRKRLVTANKKSGRGFKK